MTRPIPRHGTEGRYKGCKCGCRPACRCSTCIRGAYLANIQRARVRAVHGSNLIDRDVLLKHVTTLKASGMSQLLIGRLAGVSGSTISYIVNGRVSGVQRSKALRILAVRPGTFDDVADRPVLGSRRRLQALYAMGHGAQAIGELAGLHPEPLYDIAHGRTRVIASRVAIGIQAAYRELASRPGDNIRARRIADRNGWHGPLAWDDIDNPDEQPDTDTGEEVPLFRSLAEDGLWLEAQGYTRGQAAERLGVTKNNLQACISRARRRPETTDYREAA